MEIDTARLNDINILVVDDQTDVRKGLQKLISPLGCAVDIAASGEEAIELISQQSYDIVLTDIKMTGISGIDLLNWITKNQSGIDVVMISGFGTIEMAVHCLQNGASHFITKPFDNQEIRKYIQRTGYRILTKRNAIEKNRRYGKYHIIADDSKMKDVMNLVARAAPTNVSILIEGASGTGKELIARAVHGRSLQPDGPFIALNCAAIPNNLIESELFGYKKGAFTGAYSDTKGIFEQVKGGTIFLDEISSMSMSFQSKLLRVLEEKTVRPLGSSKSVSIKFRLICASNKNLMKMVDSGSFREDLLYRIQVVRIGLPSLNDRRESIPALCEYFIQKASRELFDQQDSFVKLSESSLEALSAHQWKGNIRELENTIQRALVICKGDVILPLDLGLSDNDDINEIFEGFPKYDTEKQHVLNTFQKRYVKNALKRTNGNITHAAELCGITRAAFQRIMKKNSMKN
ncbi:MAG: sigma-54-dependent Fis family transcriptional regulator [Candidatus Marinimicrobia bacterium]|jgi:DNA-binding NtrC family response regulator|nr:sigma-54-dependent Fis family transcriptional regulator [Candidatus Neomarinimicrobiota bacterium]MBT3682449.1 sigma-54-dependent Fis family transcriptional regulator [Candidatus Neomarinimicrobiota bacterium]MBT3759213.1 sigma-54-dependent Fis family transcriptional regulator [Candidatus Neomarinimicrobiota bacterium]MBT3895514.1 sigma-54-dependent Fis family transcriptional regulator [Candidatus Neomarinimicrobiota bacterium]MBT4172361.1 sigma-54-dependent Fis family transcriptional regula